VCFTRVDAYPKRISTCSFVRVINSADGCSDVCLQFVDILGAYIVTSLFRNADRKKCAGVKSGQRGDQGTWRNRETIVSELLAQPPPPPPLLFLQCGTPSCCHRTHCSSVTVQEGKCSGACGAWELTVALRLSSQKIRANNESSCSSWPHLHSCTHSNEVARGRWLRPCSWKSQFRSRLQVNAWPHIWATIRTICMCADEHEYSA
jgi:hypothetical protein